MDRTNTERAELFDETVRSICRTIITIPDITCEECACMVEAIAGTVLEACQPLDFNSVVDVLAGSLKERYAEIKGRKETMQ